MEKGKSFFSILIPKKENCIATVKPGEKIKILNCRNKDKEREVQHKKSRANPVK